MHAFILTSSCGRDFGQPHHAFVTLNLSRTFLVEALAAYYRAKKDAHDGRSALHVKTYNDRVLEFSRTHLFGLEDLDSARVLTWYLSTDEVRLAPDFLEHNLTNDSASAWLNINMDPTRATRGQVLRAVYKEKDYTKLTIDDEACWGQKCGDTNGTVRDFYWSEDGSPFKGDPTTKKKLIPDFGENDRHAAKTLEQAKDEAAGIREELGMELPAGARLLPSVDVDDCSLPKAPSEPACLRDAQGHHNDERDADALLTFLTHRGYRPSDPVRFDAKAAKEKVVRQRKSAVKQKNDIERIRLSGTTAEDNAGLGYEEEETEDVQLWEGLDVEEKGDEEDTDEGQQEEEGGTGMDEAPASDDAAPQ